MKIYTGIHGNALGSVLRAYRKANRFTQQKVADYLDVERTTYVKYETSRKPEMEVILKLSALYQVSVDDFFKAFFEETEGGIPDSVSVAGKPEEKNLIHVSEQELRLLEYYRNSLRKAEIMKYTEEIFNRDNEIIEEINNV